MGQDREIWFDICLIMHSYYISESINSVANLIIFHHFDILNFTMVDREI